MCEFNGAGNHICLRLNSAERAVCDSQYCLRLEHSCKQRRKSMIELWLMQQDHTCFTKIEVVKADNQTCIKLAASASPSPQTYQFPPPFRSIPLALTAPPALLSYCHLPCLVGKEPISSMCHGDTSRWLIPSPWTMPIVRLPLGRWGASAFPVS